ncbi:metal-sensitive transcriptional regulator [Paramaledivibacter caminithermalis]|jgi:DNA-binding FrmR family transcriptional regulator|uniref:DNA-binding transcriptional regulator, FrmR family n=1 Tax=Paramaledivibacter caminithermalis (strain DSM 15212 / CIP 107654 / DViRD3) TaxID=1121301 RepID=A0A1M6SH46_PARC5|nr:metal-sensitive transcriptional regulator [Paramaledivibacter caminithermalis]SHK43907.1 DNA-binding transcriptional regulator, FrmR family [Paramaledivibacter caminithermalis DSM 15212]
MANENSKKKIINRLRTLKGHIAGIEKMVEEGKDCEDILIQIAAVKSSIHKIGTIIVEEHALDCLLREDDDERFDKEKVKKVIKTLINYTK